MIAFRETKFLIFSKSQFMRFTFILFLCFFNSILTAQTEIRKSIQSRFIMAEDGETIQLDEGIFINRCHTVHGRQEEYHH